MSDPDLQEFFLWIFKKCESIHASHKPAAIRAFYLSLNLAFFLDLDIELSLTSDIDRTLNLGLTTSRTLFLFSGISLSRALDLNPSLTLDINLLFTFVFTRSLFLDHNSLPNLDRLLTLDHSIELSVKSDPKLNLKLEDLKAKLPDFQDRSAFQEWWKKQGNAWIIDLQSAMIKHRNIGHDWKTDEEQKSKLVEYYNANKLLIECLNSDCYINKEKRQEIEDTLLLPMSEIAKRERQFQRED